MASIDKFLTELLAVLTRIADAIEQNTAISAASADAKGVAAPKPVKKAGKSKPAKKEEDDDDELDLDGEDEDDLDFDDVDEPETKPKPKSKPRKTTTVGKDKKQAASEYELKDVREALKNLQQATGRKAEVMSLLKKHGASTLGQLQEGKFKAVIDDVDTKLGELE